MNTGTEERLMPVGSRLLAGSTAIDAHEEHTWRNRKDTK
jgi:hypothetical protein